MPLAGRNYVINRINNGPARQSSNRFGNALLKHVSKKAGTVTLESRRGEFADAILLDADEDVLSYFPQPTTLDLQTVNEDGRLAESTFTASRFASCRTWL